MFSSLSRTVGPAARQLSSKAAPKAAAAAAAPKIDPAAHIPAVKLFGIPARYANAAYSAASKSGSLDKVEAELQAIKNIATKNAGFKSFLQNPTLARADKVKTMASLLDGKMGDVTCNLMATLAGNARLAETVKVVDAFAELMKAKRGEVDAIITSAEPLSKATADAVSAALIAQVGKDKKVILQMKVDPTLLGGLQVMIGDKFLDLSVSSKINNIKKTLGGH